MEITLSTFIVMIINFIILLLILKFVLYKPIQEMLEKRRKKISDDLSAAQKSRESYEQLSREAKTSLEKARAEGFEIVERARNEANKVREDILRKAREEAEQLHERTAAEIERAKKIAKDELREGTVSLALAAAQKVIGGMMSDDINQSLVRNALEQIGKGVTN
jgi:F-type H+-transporting ATPase subunit b